MVGGRVVLVDECCYVCHDFFVGFMQVVVGLMVDGRLVALASVMLCVLPRLG